MANIASGMANELVAIGLNASFWIGIGILVARRVRHDVVNRVLATAITGFALVVVSLEVLGLVGSINRMSVATICVLTGFVGLLRWRADSRAKDPAGRMSMPHAAPPATPWQTVLSLVALALVVWAALLYLLLGLVFPVEPISDAPIYHLYFAAGWARSGSLGLMPTPFGEEAATYFPANGDLWLTWLASTGMGPFVKTGEWPFLVLGATALYGLARRVAAPWPAAVLPAALWVSVPIVLLQSSIANVDLVWSAFYFSAAYFLLQWLEDSESDARGLLLFALACGIVIGTKTIGGVFAVLLLLPVFALLARRRPPLRQLAWLTIGLLAPSAYWYGRNVWLTGNPVYPLQLSLFGRVWAEGWYGQSAMEATAYHLPVTAWRTFLARLWLVAGGIGLTFAVVGVVSGGVQSFRSSIEPRTRRALALFSGLAIAQVALYWCVVPYNTQERFLSTAFGFAFIPLSTLVAGQPALHAAVCLLVGWQLVAPRYEGAFTLLRLHDNPLALGSAWAPWCLPASILIAAVALKWALRARWIVAGMAVLLGSYVAARPAAGWLTERPLLRFYPRTEFASRLWPGWEILERAALPTGSKVAYTGTNLPYYLLAIGLRNEVYYVNINAHLDWLPHDYHRHSAAALAPARDPWPQWYRTDADFDSWIANLRRRQIEFLFVARENRHGRVEPRPGELPRFPIEKDWADAHPEQFDDLGPFSYPPGTIPWVRVYRVIAAP
jgi:hypothetical protein